jgi:hypothetical protein
MNSPRPYCSCGKPVKNGVSRSQKNPGRTYVSCPIPKEQGGCGYFCFTDGKAQVSLFRPTQWEGAVAPNPYGTATPNPPWNIGNVAPNSFATQASWGERCETKIHQPEMSWEPDLPTVSLPTPVEPKVTQDMFMALEERITNLENIQEVLTSVLNISKENSNLIRNLDKSLSVVVNK